jgi:hypothetical protein
MSYLYDTFGRLSVQADIGKESVVTLEPLCVSVAGDGSQFPQTSELTWYRREARRLTEAGKIRFQNGSVLEAPSGRRRHY